MAHRSVELSTPFCFFNYLIIRRVCKIDHIDQLWSRLLYHLVSFDVLHLGDGHINPQLLSELEKNSLSIFLLQVNQWKRQLFVNCFTNQTLCLITYFAPCVTFGYNKQRLHNLQDKVLINVTPLFDVYISQLKQKRSWYFTWK